MNVRIRLPQRTRGSMARSARATARASPKMLRMCSPDKIDDFDYLVAFIAQKLADLCFDENWSFFKKKTSFFEKKSDFRPNFTKTEIRGF